MKNWPLLLLPTLLFACANPPEKTEPAPQQRAKFEPADGQCLLFVGQELEAIGGLADYHDGYFDHFPKPAGFTMYTGISPEDVSFETVAQSMRGIWSTDDWGDGPSNMSLQLADEDFSNSALAIGFWMVNHEEGIAKGRHDLLLSKFSFWLKSLGRRPVFLRIGYEFAGEWNHYDRENYIAAFRHIHDFLDAGGVTNVAYVWQSHGWEEPDSLLEAWYPGDAYVDWCAYSFFSRYQEANMIAFAEKHHKPVFIAEATPTISTETVKTDGKTKETILSNPEEAKEAWELWFVPLFKTIRDHPKTVKALSYINCNWKSHPMWKNNKTFQDIDARLQTSAEISEKWLQETSKDRYLKASPQLFELLWGNTLK